MSATKTNTLRQRWARLVFWFTHRRMCSWCKRPHWIGGNPFAKNHTDGMCAAAQRQWQIDAEASSGSRSS